jgi:hypothetical protein
LCEVFDVEFVAFDEDELFNWIEMIKCKSKAWDGIVVKNSYLGLRWRILLVLKHLM